MIYCANCGNAVEEGVKFCPSCGTAVVKAKDTSPQQDVDSNIQADPAEVEQGKLMAIIAYIIFFIPLLTGDHQKSNYVKFHTNQGTVLFLFAVAGYIVSSILVFVLIGLILMPIVGIGSLILCIIGIINAVNGTMKPLPIIGKFTIIK